MFVTTLAGSTFECLMVSLFLWRFLYRMMNRTKMTTNNKANFTQAKTIITSAKGSISVQLQATYVIWNKRLVAQSKQKTTKSSKVLAVTAINTAMRSEQNPIVKTIMFAIQN